MTKHTFILAAAALAAAAMLTPPAADAATTVQAPPGGVIVWGNAASLDVVDVTVNLIAANADGSGQHVLTPKRSGVSDADATISPDGSQVLFARNHDDTAELRLVPIDGGPTTVVPLPCRGGCIGYDKGTWLSGKRIAFTKYVSGDQYKNGYAGILYTARLDGTGLRRLSPAGRDGVYEEMYARLSPDHSFFVFARERIRDGDAAVFRMAPDGTGVRRLTPWSLQAQLPHLSPATSGPTAGLIVFQSYGEGNPDGSSRDLVTVPADCASPAACRAALAYVTHNGMGTARASNPAWSPDGSHLVYAGRPSENDVNCEIVTIAYDGSGAHTVSTSAAFDYRPDWGRG